VTRAAYIASSLIVPVLLTEVVLGRRKLQAALSRVLSTWAVSYAAAVVWFVVRLHAAFVPFTIFWVGAFLTWFGVRSHIESSIVVRMLVLLRDRPLTDAELAAEYLAACGENRRLDELCRGGLVARGDQGLQITPKGELVSRVTAALR
jgi:hypothetical protein